MSNKGPATNDVQGITPFDQLIPPPTVRNDEHQSFSIPIFIIVSAVFATLSVAGRIFHRKTTAGLGLDDFAILVALVFYMGWSIMAVYICIKAGIGKPLWEITLEEFTVWYEGVFAAAWIYPVMSASIRASILLLYRRLFGQASGPIFRALIWTLLVLQAVYVIAFSITPGFLCTPLSEGVKPYERLRHCTVKYYYKTTEALYGSGVGFDFILLLMPVFTVFKLNTSLGKRLSIAAIFILGASAGIAAAYKLAVFVQQASRPPSQAGVNPTYLKYQVSRYVPWQFDSYGTTFWVPSHIEPTVALIGTSLPAVVRFFSAAWTYLSDISRSRLSSFRSRERVADENSLELVESDSSKMITPTKVTPDHHSATTAPRSIQEKV